MAKANPHTGTSHYVAEGEPVPDLPGVRLVGPGAPEDASEVERPPTSTSEVAKEEGERSSPGSNSSRSTGKRKSSDEPNSPPPREPAQTTEPSSKSDQTGSGSAGSTGGRGRKGDK